MQETKITEEKEMETTYTTWLWSSEMEQMLTIRKWNSIEQKGGYVSLRPNEHHNVHIYMNDNEGAVPCVVNVSIKTVSELKQFIYSTWLTWNDGIDDIELTLKGVSYMITRRVIDWECEWGEDDGAYGDTIWQLLNTLDLALSC